MNDERCETCRFYIEEISQEYGHCRRRAPVAFKMTPISPVIGSWPSVGPKGWCGEYQQLSVRT